MQQIINVIKEQLSDHIYYQTKYGILLQGNCLKILPKLNLQFDVVITDPPYGINITPQRKNSKFKNTYIQNDDSIKIIKQFLEIISNFTNTIYMFTSWKELGNIQPIFEKYFTYKNCLVWDKQWFGIGNNWRPTHEFILYGTKDWNGKILSNNKSNILKYKRLSSNKLTHIAEKPVSLLKDIIAQHKGIVLDPFIGSGSTAIACEELQRYWIGIEITPAYCKVAKQRLKLYKNNLFDIAK